MRRVLVSCVMILLVAGCGQTGPLYLPDQAAAVGDCHDAKGSAQCP